MVMGVLRTDIQPIKIVDGFTFMEGPAFGRDGLLYAVDGHQGLVVRIDPATGDWTTYCKTEGGPNGSAFHRDGRLFCTDPPLRAIVEIPRGGGAYRVFTDKCYEDGEPLRGPNDLRFHRNGDLYFTDPGGSSVDVPIGSVYYAKPNGWTGRFARGLAFPNGLTFSADWSTLYVAESGLQRVHAWRLNPDGSAGEHRIFAQLRGFGYQGRRGQPDGLAFGADGNLYVAHWDMATVDVVDPAGEVIAHLPMPGARVTNLAFGGASLYVSEGSIAGIWRLDIGVRGQPLFADL
jgi:gluconolactonase